MSLSSTTTACRPHHHVTVIHDDCTPSTLPRHCRPQQLHASTPPRHRRPYVVHTATSLLTVRRPCCHITVDPTTARCPHRPHCHINPNYHTHCACHVTANVTRYPVAAPSFLKGCGRHVITLPNLAATRQMGSKHEEERAEGMKRIEGAMTMREWQSSMNPTHHFIRALLSKGGGTPRHQPQGWCEPHTPSHFFTPWHR